MTMTTVSRKTQRVATLAALVLTAATTVAAQVPASGGPAVTVTRLAGSRVLIEGQR